jgi:glycosyltransferase involved in cell wall biosynthesis
VIKVAHICTDNSNVAYAQSQMMKKYDIDSTIYIPRKTIDSAVTIHYGYESGNPYDIKIKYLSNDEFRRGFELLEINTYYDILHLHDGAGAFGAFFCGYGSAKILYQFHGSVIREGLPTFTFPIMVRKFLWKHLGLYDKVIVSTPDLVKQWQGSELLLDPIDPTLSQKVQTISEPFILSSHRCSDSIKGTNIVFDAWDTVKKEHPELSLIVIDWGEDKEKYKLRTKDDPTVIWKPMLNRETYLNLLSKARVFWGQFIIPAFGLSEIEAMFSGIPVISEAKINSNYLSERTNKILSNNDFKKDILAHQERVLEFYDEKKLSKRLFDIYNEILGSKQSNI